jgi:hypothetical protein
MSNTQQDVAAPKGAEIPDPRAWRHLHHRAGDPQHMFERVGARKP